MPADAHLGETRARGAELIVRAFARARESGKPDWRVMTTAVLKNRLLDLTEGAFHEADWGATTIAEFVNQFSDLVTLDTSTRPARVHLVETAEPEGTQSASLLPLGPRRRIRADLWRAVLDYGGEHVYVWDGDGAIAVKPASVAAGDSRPALPTTTREEFAAWRAQFVAAHEDVPAPLRASLETWREQGSGTKSLPPRFRNAWTGEVKRRVLERLMSWFAEHDLQPPSDLVETPDLEDRHEFGVEALRAFVHECVQAMTREELEGLALPARVAARVRR